MSGNIKLLSLLVLIGLLLSTQPAGAIAEQSVSVFDDQVFFALGPGAEALDQALAKNYPDWAPIAKSL